MLCHYWYFLHKNVSYGPYLCDDYYNFSQKSRDFKNIAIVHVKKNTRRIYFWCMSKREARKKWLILIWFLEWKYYDNGNNKNNNSNNNNNNKNVNVNENENENANKNENDNKNGNENKQKKIL